MDPRLNPLSAQDDFDPASINNVIDTHLHSDQCGGHHLFTGRPIYVQHRELDNARSQDDLCGGAGAVDVVCSKCNVLCFELQDHADAGEVQAALEESVDAA